MVDGFEADLDYKKLKLSNNIRLLKNSSTRFVERRKFLAVQRPRVFIEKRGRLPVDIVFILLVSSAIFVQGYLAISS